MKHHRPCIGEPADLAPKVGAPALEVLYAAQPHVPLQEYLHLLAQATVEKEGTIYVVHAD